MTWVETLGKLTNPDGTKLYPELFYECSGCNGTGWTKINLQFGAWEKPKCVQFKCEDGFRSKESAKIMGVLVRIYGELFPDETVVTFREKEREPEEVLAEVICMRVALRE